MVLILQMGRLRLEETHTGPAEPYSILVWLAVPMKGFYFALFSVTAKTGQNDKDDFVECN